MRNLLLKSNRDVNFLKKKPYQTSSNRHIIRQLAMELRLISYKNVKQYTGAYPAPISHSKICILHTFFEARSERAARSCLAILYHCFGLTTARIKKVVNGAVNGVLNGL